MAETVYKWVVISMLEAPKLDNLENVITFVSFSYVGSKLKGKDDKGNDEFYTAIWSSGLQLSKPDPNNFKPLNELTQDEVIEWVTKDLELEPIKEYIDQEITKQINPTNIPVVLPWDNN